MQFETQVYLKATALAIVIFTKNYAISFIGLSTIVVNCLVIMSRIFHVLVIGIYLPEQQAILEHLEQSPQQFKLLFASIEDFLGHSLEQHLVDLVLISFDGIDRNKKEAFFGRLKQVNPVIPVIVLGGEDTAVKAVQYMQMGAADYIPNPHAVLDQLPAKIIRFVENRKRQNRQSRTMETLGRISLALNATRDQSELLDLICQESSQLFGVGSAFIWLLEGDELVGFAGYGYGREKFIGLRIPLSDQIVMGPKVIRENRPIFINNAHSANGIDQELRAMFNIKSILGTPLVTENKAIGALMLLDNVNPQRFERADVDLAWLLGSHVAIAIKNARLYEEISERVEDSNRRSEELEALRQASFHLTANLELKPLLGAIIEKTMRLIDTTNVHIFLYDGKTLSFGAARWSDGREETPYSTVRQDGLTAAVARQGQPIIIPNVNEHELFQDWQWGGGIAGFPLKIGDEVLGVMNIAAERPHEFDIHEQRILNLFADEAAIAIKNAQLFEATRRQLEELTVLHSVAIIGVKAADEDTLIDETTRIIGETFYPHNFGVLLLNETKDLLVVHSSYRVDGLPVEHLQVSTGIVGQVARTGKPMRIDDVRESEIYYKGDPTTLAELCVPLKVGDRIMGVINAESDTVAAFTDNDERLLTTLASQLAIALERLRTETTERRQRKRLQLISELAREMTGLLEINELCTIVAERLLHEFNYYNVSIFLVSPNKRELILQYNAGAYAELLDIEHKEYKQAFGSGLIGLAAQTAQSQVYNDTREAPEFFSLNGMEILAEASFPLKVGDRVIGVLNIDSSEYDKFDSGDVATLLAISDQLAVTLEKARLFQETRQRSEDLESAQDILQAINAYPNVTNAFPIVAIGLKAITGCNRTSIALLEEEDNWFSIYALDQSRDELDQGVRMPVALTACATNVLAGRPHLTPDLEKEIDFPAEKVLYDAGHRSRINIPLHIEEKVIGSLNLVWTHEAGYDPYQLPLLSQIAQAIALAVDKTRLFTEVRQRARELDFLNKVIGASSSARTAADVLYIGCKELALFFDVPQAALALLDESRTYETVVAEYLAPGRVPVMHEQIPVANNLALQEVFKTGQPLAVEDVQNHPSTHPIRDLLAKRGTVSLLLIPIPVRGRIVGTLGVDAISPRSFTDEELSLVKTVGEELGRALETAQLHEQLQAHAAELEERVQERTKELAEANEQLKELDRLKSKFVSDVSHELRTPVANLWLYLDLLERGRSERRQHYLDVLKKETKRLEQLIENTLNLSRIEKNDSQAAFEDFDINQLVEQIFTAYQPRAKVDNLRFDFSPGRNMPPLRGARNQLAQVINNLLSNAFNYTEKGFVRVRTYDDRLNNHIVVEVIDSGIGIDPEDLPHLFDRFYRGRHTGQSDIPGTGLGLAIAKEIIDRHRGFIEVDSKEAGETVFRVRLPYSPELQVPARETP